MAVLELLHGDCRAVMAGMPAASVDAVVCDPPYGLSFMGKDWDHGIPGVAFWSAALRVAKPGAHLLAFGGTRTFHRLAVAIEDAGWEIRDTVMWVYGSGFPKSHDVGKGIDKAAGAEREAVTTRKAADLFEAEREIVDVYKTLSASDVWRISKGFGGESVDQSVRNITAPATAAARQWEGWGTALKPAWEPIIVARKPLEGTVAANVLAHGTGALNIDGCRVEGADAAAGRTRHGGGIAGNGTSYELPDSRSEMPAGRWPANLIHDGSDEVVGLFPQSAAGSHPQTPTHSINAAFGGGRYDNSTCYGDTGSAARFFYCAKASKADRDEGCGDLPERAAGTYAQDEWSRQNMGNTPDAKRGATRNHHPTVKPTALMRYLCKLVTPPAGTVLDPFMGSGSTGKAARMEGFGFIGIEQDADYIDIARARIAHAVQSPAQQSLHI